MPQKLETLEPSARGLRLDLYLPLKHSRLGLELPVKDLCLGLAPQRFDTWLELTLQKFETWLVLAPKRLEVKLRLGPLQSLVSSAACQRLFCCFSSGEPRQEAAVMVTMLIRVFYCFFLCNLNWWDHSSFGTKLMWSAVLTIFYYQLTPVSTGLTYWIANYASTQISLSHTPTHTHRFATML